jgi:glycerol uptake facilitator-like aquaporin
MDYQILIIQAVGTIVLCFVLNYTTGKASPSQDKALRQLAYAATFMLLIYTARRQGWCFNPAVALAITLQETFNAPNAFDNLTRYTYAYVSGPIIGAIISGFIYMAYERLIVPDDDCEDDNEDNKA